MMDLVLTLRIMFDTPLLYTGFLVARHSGKFIKHEMNVNALNLFKAPEFIRILTTIFYVVDFLHIFVCQSFWSVSQF